MSIISNISEIVPSGYQCVTASILKKYNIKTVSYPWDWCFSTISTIQDCIETDFVNYLNKDFYIPPKLDDENEHSEYIDRCGHQLYATNYFQHRDVRKPHHYEYALRCVSRFRNLMLDSNKKKLLLHISKINKTEFGTSADINYPIYDSLMKIDFALAKADKYQDNAFFLYVHLLNTDKPLTKSPLQRVGKNTYMLTLALKGVENKFYEEIYDNEYHKGLGFKDEKHEKKLLVELQKYFSYEKNT